MAKQKEAAQNMIGRQTNNTGFAAVPASRPVRVDGSLDEWDLSGQIESYADTSIKDTFSVRLHLLNGKGCKGLQTMWQKILKSIGIHGVVFPD